MAAQRDIDIVVRLCTNAGVDPKRLLPAGVTRFEDLTASQMSLVSLSMTSLLHGSQNRPPKSTTESKAAPGNAPMMTPAQRAFLQKLTRNNPGFLAEFARRCGGAVTAKQASAEIKRLQSRPTKPLPLVTNGKGIATTTAPVGRYAVEALGRITLVEITKPTEGKWAGYTFVKTAPHLEGYTPEAVRGDEAVLVLNEIESDQRYCATRYGRITGRCGQCNRRLSDPQSLSLGIGPDCLMNFA